MTDYDDLVYDVQRLRWMRKTDDDYTPTMGEVRSAFVWQSAGDNECAREAATEDFDRWLANHNALVLEDLEDRLGENQMIREGDVKEWIRYRASLLRRGVNGDE